jgi:hypothetical protein
MIVAGARTTCSAADSKAYLFPERQSALPAATNPIRRKVSEGAPRVVIFIDCPQS